MQKHLAIFTAGEGEMILSGKKTIEGRFSKKKIAPFGVVSSGDLVYIKPSGKDVIGQFRVRKVINYDGLNAQDLEEIRKRYERQLKVEEKFWNAHLNAKFATLIFIGQVDQFITSPIKVSKKDQRGWMVLPVGRQVLG